MNILHIEVGRPSIHGNREFRVVMTSGKKVFSIYTDSWSVRNFNKKVRRPIRVEKKNREFPLLVYKTF